MNNKWLELEHAVLAANSTAYLLTGALEESDSKDKREAVASAAHHLQDLVRKT